MIRCVYKKWQLELVGTCEWRAVQWVVRWFLKLTTGSCVWDEIVKTGQRSRLHKDVNKQVVACLL